MSKDATIKVLDHKVIINGVNQAVAEAVSVTLGPRTFFAAHGLSSAIQSNNNGPIQSDCTTDVTHAGPVKSSF